MFRKSPSGSLAKLQQNYGSGAVADFDTTWTDVAVIDYDSANGRENTFFSQIVGSLIVKTITVGVGGNTLQIRAVYADDSGNPHEVILNDLVAQYVSLVASDAGNYSVFPFAIGIDFAGIPKPGVLTIQARTLDANTSCEDCFSSVLIQDWS